MASFEFRLYQKALILDDKMKDARTLSQSIKNAEEVLEPVIANIFSTEKMYTRGKLHRKLVRSNSFQVKNQGDQLRIKENNAHLLSDQENTAVDFVMSTLHQAARKKNTQPYLLSPKTSPGDEKELKKVISNAVKNHIPRTGNICQGSLTESYYREMKLESAYFYRFKHISQDEDNLSTEEKFFLMNIKNAVESGMIVKYDHDILYLLQNMREQNAIGARLYENAESIIKGNTKPKRLWVDRCEEVRPISKQRT